MGLLVLSDGPERPLDVADVSGVEHGPFVCPIRRRRR